MQTAAKSLQPLIEFLPDCLIGQELFELLHVLLVFDRLEQVPELIVQLGQLPDFLADIMDRVGQICGVKALEGAVGRKRCVQLSKQPFIVDDESELFLCRAVFIEPVHAGDRLQQVMLAKGLADVKHGVARCIKAGEQLRNDDEDFRIAGTFERVDDLPGVFVLALVARHHSRPKAAHKVLRFLVDLLIALVVIRR